MSYDRIVQLSIEMANGVIDLFEEDGVVCPTNLREGLFTTGNLDNLDRNPSSTSAQTAFHGTAISLTQHVTVDITGTEHHRNRVQFYSPRKHQKQKNNIKPLTLSPVNCFEHFRFCSFLNINKSVRQKSTYKPYIL